MVTRGKRCMNFCSVVIISSFHDKETKRQFLKKISRIVSFSQSLTNSLATACTSVIDDVSVFHLLLSRSNAVASIADQNGALPLHLACQNQLLPSVVRLIVQAYPRAIEVKDRQGNTPKDITMLLANGQRRDDILQVLRLASRYVKRWKRTIRH